MIIKDNGKSVNLGIQLGILNVGVKSHNNSEIGRAEGGFYGDVEAELHFIGGHIRYIGKGRKILHDINDCLGLYTSVLKEDAACKGTVSVEIGIDANAFKSGKKIVYGK